MKLEELLDNKLSEVIEKLFLLLIEVKQITIHQASISGEDIDEGDVE